MSAGLAILCYHRVEDAGDDLWPYRERGTAVRLATFERQLDALQHRVDLVDEAGALAHLDGAVARRPAVWLTFDDGYRELVTLVAPRLAEGGVTATAFVSTAVLAGTLLPADRWYRVLLTATRTTGRVDLGDGAFTYDLRDPVGRARLVHGPERRRYLRASPAERDRAIAALAETLGAPSGATPSPYLTASDLSTLLRGGWSLGTHGHSHDALDDLTPTALTRELDTSRAALASLGAAVRSLALPDGTPASEPAALVRAGFQCVLGLGDAPGRRGPDGVVPRYLVPDDPDWVDRVLVPALEVP